MKKLSLFFSLFVVTTAMMAQTIAFPDSAAVVKNKVKVAKVYFTSADGQRYLQKLLTYDKSGRLLTERENENTFYYEYVYDEKGRKISTTQKTKDGERIQQFTEEHIDKDTSRKVRLFLNGDGAQPSYIYYYDKYGRKTKEEHYNQLGMINRYQYWYDGKGKQIATYDSTGYMFTASLRTGDLLTERHIYNADGKLLHWYTFTYNEAKQVTGITDSTGIQPTQKYVVEYGAAHVAIGATQNGQKMSASSWANFRKEVYFIFPESQPERENGLPAAEIVNEHHFTYDKKGNIVRDDLVQKSGSFSQTYVYEYEYEFY